MLHAHFSVTGYTGRLQTFVGQISRRGKSSFSHRALPRSRRAEEERKKTSPLDRGKAFILMALLLTALGVTFLVKQNKAKKS